MDNEPGIPCLAIAVHVLVEGCVSRSNTLLYTRGNYSHSIVTLLLLTTRSLLKSGVQALLYHTRSIGGLFPAFIITSVITSKHHPVILLLSRMYLSWMACVSDTKTVVIEPIFYASYNNTIHLLFNLVVSSNLASLDSRHATITKHARRYGYDVMTVVVAEWNNQPWVV